MGCVMAKRDDRTEEFVTVRIPAPLADRIDRVYADCRGFEPSSMQESLSVLCDLAAGRLDVADGTAHDRLDRSLAPRGSPGATARGQRATTGAQGTTSRDDERERPSVADLDEERRANIDAAFPSRWSVDPVVAGRLTAVVDHYVRNPSSHADADAREAEALHAVGEDEGLSPDELRASLVASLYGNTGLPDDLAGEFFSEALRAVADATDPADASEDAVEDEETSDGSATSTSVSSSSMVESPVSGSSLSEASISESSLLDDGTHALTDGAPGHPARPAQNLDPEDAFDSPTDEVTVDSLLAEEAAPTARCERCEAYHPVDDLETVIGSKSATIELLCEECTVDVEENP